MNLNEYHVLLSPSGQEALGAAQALNPREIDFLAHFQRLCRRYPSDLSRSALEIAILRIEGTKKFPFASELYFTREALQQASSWAISTFRAERYREFGSIIDLGCSIGSDTLALANYAPVTGIDIDPLRLSMAKENARSIQPSWDVSFVQADLQSSIPLRRVRPSPALFFDPTRRVNHRRVYSIYEYVPPLTVVHDWLPRFPALGVKISPGVKLEEIEAFDTEVEFISLNGNLKEAVLWFGPLKRHTRRATVLPGAHSLTADLSVGEIDRQKLPLSEPLAYLYEPDPAVLRAGLVFDLGERLNAYQLDLDIAYLTSATRVSTPFARSWAVEDWMPFGLKRLRAYLREREVGEVIVKKRASPLQPEELIRKLKLRGTAKRVVFLTHLRGSPIAIICFSRTIRG